MLHTEKDLAFAGSFLLTQERFELLCYNLLTMEQNPGDKKNTYKNLSEVLPIQKSLGLRIIKKEQIREIVERPLVAACEEFWDKNIRTHDSSANSKDIERGYCYIRLDFDYLSDKNKEIAEQYSKPYMDVGVQLIELDIPLLGSESVQEISQKALDIANSFEKQPPTWIHPITLEQTLEDFEARYGTNNPESVQKEKERLSQPGAWEAECERLGKYFDSATQTAWDSEECFKKFDEYFEIQR